MASVLPGGPADPPANRRSRLDYGQALRDQIQADRNRRQLERQGLDMAPPRQAFDQISPNQNVRQQQRQRLPVIPGAVPSPGQRRRRSAGPQRPHSSGSEIGRGEVGMGEKMASPQRALWEGEAYKLTEQVQEMLISLHGRLAGLEKGVRGEEKSVGEMRERLQLVEMDHAAMRAEQKTLCSNERLLQLERDTSSKLHRHLEHVTSVEAEQLSQAMGKVHALQVQAEDERRRAEKLQEESRQHNEALAKMTERLRAVEERNVGLESREAEGFQAMSEHRARLEFRVQELESALVSVSSRGEQVALDTGNAVRTFVDAKNAELVSQLQQAVIQLTAQVSSVQQEVQQRGKDLVEMAHAEGRARAQDVGGLSEGVEEQLARMRRALDEERVRNDSNVSEGRKVLEEMRARVEEALRAGDAGVREAVARVQGDQRDLRGELRELSDRALASAEESRRFLEEVVRAEIRGRMQGQQQLNDQLIALDEALKKGGGGGEGGGGGGGGFDDEVYSQMRLVAAKQKAQAKALKALSGEVDAARHALDGFQEECRDELKATAGALRHLEERVSSELQMGAQAARDTMEVLEARVGGLEDGRSGVLEKIYLSVDANRAKDLERAKETMERIDGLQRAVDACVEMCQSDLQEVHEGLESVESRLDKEAEGLEAMVESTARQLTSALDDKLQESMTVAVDNLAAGLKRDMEFVRNDLVRVGEHARDVDAKVKSVRRGAEGRAREAERELARVEEQAAADVQKVRDDVWGLRSAYVARMDAVDERVSEARGDAARHAAESAHRDTVLDAKVRGLEQRLLHAGGGTLAQSALGGLGGGGGDLLGDSLHKSLVGGSGALDVSRTSVEGLGGGGGGFIGALQAEVAGIKERAVRDREAAERRASELAADLEAEKKRALREVAALLERVNALYAETAAQGAALNSRQDADAKALEQEMATTRAVLAGLRGEAATLVAQSEARAAERFTSLRDALEEAAAATHKDTEGLQGRLGQLEERVSHADGRVDEAAAAAAESVRGVREELEGVQAAQAEKDSALEARVRALFVELSNTTADNHVRLVQTVSAVTSRADELAQTAIELRDAQSVWVQRLKEDREGASRAMKAQGGYVCQIADAHRRDIDKVCRDAACAQVVEALVSRVEAQELVSRAGAFERDAARRLGERVEALGSDVVNKVVPPLVKGEVAEAVRLQVLPVEYEVKGLRKEFGESKGTGEAKARQVDELLYGLTKGHKETGERLGVLERASEQATGGVLQLKEDTTRDRAEATRRADALQSQAASDGVAAAVDGMVLRLEVDAVGAAVRVQGVKTDSLLKRQGELVMKMGAAAEGQNGAAKSDVVSSLIDRVDKVEDAARGMEEDRKKEKARIDEMDDLLKTVAEQVSEQDDESSNIELVSTVMNQVTALEKRVELVEAQRGVSQDNEPDLPTVAEEEDEGSSRAGSETPGQVGAESSESTDAMWADAGKDSAGAVSEEGSPPRAAGSAGAEQPPPAAT